LTIMTEQDNQDRRKQDRRESSRPQSGAEGGEPLESLLLDEQQRAGSVDRVAEWEIRAVKRRRARRNGWWLVVLGVLLLAGTLGYLGLQPQPLSPTRPQPKQETVRRAMPERPQSLPAKAAQGGKSDNLSAKQETVAGSEAETKPALGTTAPAAADGAERAEQAVSETPPDTREEPPPQQLFQVMVGPFITAAGLEQARELLRAEGLRAEAVPGTGPVAMIRLREGRYRGDQGQQRLAELKGRVSSAFLLPEEGMQVLYLGSFRDPERARQLQRELARDNIEVSQVRTRLTMEGTLLLLQAERRTAEQLAERLAQDGLIARLRKVE
jgi:hypothetical protein